MKKIIYTLLLMLPATGFAQAPNFVVKSKVGHLGNPAKAYLRYTVNDKTIVDSAAIQNGEFEFKGNINEPVSSLLFINSKGNGLNGSEDYLSLYIEKGTTLINSADSAKNATVSGTKISQEYARYLLVSKKINQEGLAIEDMVSNASPALRATAAFQKKVDSLTEVTQKRECEAYVRYIKENPSSPISLSALSGYDYYADYTEVEPLFHSLTPDVQNSETGKKYVVKLATLKTVAIGNLAPEFSSNDTIGNPVKLSSFRGKYVLVDFWASWCMPCRQENPNILKAYNQYKDKNFTVLGVSMDLQSAKSAWLNAVKTDGLPWTQVSDLAVSGNRIAQNRVAALYGVRAIPSNFLIGPDGRIVAKSLHGAQLRNKLMQLLDN